jgi:hypothetical protein
MLETNGRFQTFIEKERGIEALRKKQGPSIGY